MIRRNLWNAWVWIGAGVLLLVVAASSQAVGRASTSAPVPVDEKTIALKPSVTFVKASFLTGELQDLRVVERVERGSGKLVGAPVFRAKLTVINDSRDQAARLIGGKIEYIDPGGNVIDLPHSSFSFIAAPTNRLDPGMRTSQVIEVPFPISALKPNGLREVSLELIYLPIPYHEDTVNIPVYLGS